MHKSAFKGRSRNRNDVLVGVLNHVDALPRITSITLFSKVKFAGVRECVDASATVTRNGHAITQYWDLAYPLSTGTRSATRLPKQLGHDPQTETHKQQQS
jgi:hypothetical protein